MWRLIVALVLVVLAAQAVLFRYTIEVGARGDGVPVAYVLDRWTGTVHFVGSALRREVPEVKTPE